MRNNRKSSLNLVTNLHWHYTAGVLIVFYQKISKIKGFSLFNYPHGGGVNPDPPQGEINQYQKAKEIHSGPKDFYPQEGKSGPENQKDTGAIESLEFFYQLCNIETNLLNIFNKLNDTNYVNGIVNLSKHTLTKSEISVLSKGLGFCPTAGVPDIGNIIQNLDAFKRITRINLFFQGSNEDLEPGDTQSGVPFEHKSLKPKSTFNPVGPFQLETMFYSIEQDLHRLKFKQPKKKNLTHEEYKSIKSLKNNSDIIIKPADKGSAVVILNKDYYIAEGERQLQDQQFL